MICNNPELRKRLQEITDNNQREKVSNQVKEISNLSRIHPHSIKLEKEAKPGDPLTFAYNCYMYVFDLLDSSTTKDIAQLPSEMSLSEYVLYLIYNKLLTKINRAKTKDGDYVVYFHDKKPKHVGKFRRGKVVSKWGSAHLWEHGICEVPVNYGNEVQFFRQISKNQCISAFKQWFDLIKLKR